MTFSILYLICGETPFNYFTITHNIKLTLITINWQFTDTEDASETEEPPHKIQEEPVEIKEQ